MKVQLKGIASFSKGEQINGDQLLADGLYDYLNGGINPSGKWEDFNVEGNTIAISEGGNSCGYVNYMSDRFWCGAHCYYLYDIKCKPKYLYYLLKSHEDSIMKLRSGACMPNIKKKDLGEFTFWYDSDEDYQNKVIELFDILNDIIDKRQRQYSKLDELIKSRFVEIFGDGSFDTVKLNKVCTKITDGTHKTPNYLIDGIPFISAKNIINNEVDFSDVKYISDGEYEEIQKRCQTEMYDILLSKSGSLGSPAILRTNERIGLFESLAIIKYDRDKLLPEFLREQIKSETIQQQFRKGTKGVAVKHLHLNVIGNTEIVLPPINLQKQFADFVTKVEQQKATVQKSINRLETLKNSLMQEYFG